MAAIATGETEPTVPTDRDAALAAEASRKLAAALGSGATVPVRFGAEPGQTVEMPAGAARLLLDVLRQMARGNASKPMPDRGDGELTPREAAAMLDVSPTHLEFLLDEEMIKHRKDGDRRLVPAEDLRAFQRERLRCAAALDELTELDQELDLQ